MDNKRIGRQVSAMFHIFKVFELIYDEEDYNEALKLVLYLWQHQYYHKTQNSP